MAYSMTGPEKVAIFMVAIGDELAGKILSELNDTEIQKISSYMKAISEIPKKNIDAVIEEFITMIESGKSGVISAGEGYLKKILESSMDPAKAEEILGRIDSGESELGGGLNTLKNLDPVTISNFLKSEHPQTCAVILSHIEPDHAAEVVKNLPEKFQTDVLFRMATLERVPSVVIRELDEALSQEFKSLGAADGAMVGGVEAVAKIVNHLDRATEGIILSAMESINSELVENIRKLMFVFEDLIKIDDRSMQNILKDINSNDLIIALKTAPEELREKIYKNMSSRAATMLKEDFEAMGPVKLTDVEKAQQNILKMVKQLEQDGKIVLAGGGEELV